MEPNLEYTVVVSSFSLDLLSHQSLQRSHDVIGRRFFEIISVLGNAVVSDNNNNYDCYITK